MLCCLILHDTIFFLIEKSELTVYAKRVSFEEKITFKQKEAMSGNQNNLVNEFDHR